MRFTPGIPFTSNGIAAVIDANGYRAGAEAIGMTVTDEQLDAFAREQFAWHERRHQPTEVVEKLKDHGEQ